MLGLSRIEFGNIVSLRFMSSVGSGTEENNFAIG